MRDSNPASYLRQVFGPDLRELLGKRYKLRPVRSGGRITHSSVGADTLAASTNLRASVSRQRAGT